MAKKIMPRIEEEPRTMGGTPPPLESKPPINLQEELAAFGMSGLDIPAMNSEAMEALLHHLTALSDRLRALRGRLQQEFSAKLTHERALAKLEALSPAEREALVKAAGTMGERKDATISPEPVDSGATASRPGQG